MKRVAHKIKEMSGKQKISLSVVAAALIAGGLFVGCGGGDDSTTTTTSFTPLTTEPVIAGTDLFCDGVIEVTSTVAKDFNASQVIGVNVSSASTDDASRVNPNAANTLVRLGTISIPPLTSGGADANGTTKESLVHPLLISYAEQVYADARFTPEYELGDGSADIGDPTHWDDIFVSLSRDDGTTWKKYKISDNISKAINVRSSIDVQWDLNGDHVLQTDEKIAYPPHAHKPTMVASGNNILVAWHSKYCPSGNPLDLTQVTATDGTTSYPTDYFKMNGTQGSILYTADDGSVMIAPNGKYVYEVPFSCVWTARGIFNTDTNEIDWMQPQQLTSGTRDANKVTIAEAVPGAGSPAGFAITWQEDPEGLRSGGGEGPGDGWSGATTNHGADIWYSMITMDDFVQTDWASATKPVPTVNFSYPVRVTDNEACKVGDTKSYCAPLCDKYGTETVTTTVNNKDQTLTYCKTGDVDMLTGQQVVLNGDTGASRPVIKLLKTNADTSEYVVVLGYEETKGLSEKVPGDTTTNIALEGKSVYYETFPFKKATMPTNEKEFNALVASLPMVSSGNIINTKTPAQDTGELIYENARRLTFIPQIDGCTAGKYTYGWLYKQGTETQGGSSDMYVRMNTQFGYSSLEAPVNVSSNAYVDENGTSTWTTANLADTSYANLIENTFSPRGFIRGDDIYIGFEYTPDYHPDSGYAPNNFYIHRYTNGAWQGPQNISKIYGNNLSTLDPRFVTTPKGKYSITGLESDKTNPDVLFMSFGTFDTITGIEQDLYYTRSTDKGVTWEMTGTSGVTPNANLAIKNDIEEKEVQSLATPDGTRLFNAWLQESATFNSSDHFSGLDTWFGLVDYNISTTPTE